MNVKDGEEYVVGGGLSYPTTTTESDVVMPMASDHINTGAQRIWERLSHRQSIREQLLLTRSIRSIVYST